MTATFDLPATLDASVAKGVAQQLAQSVRASQGEVVLNAATLTRFDSSALAVMLACRREALAAARPFHVQGLAAPLQSLAGLYGVADLLLAHPAEAAPAAPSA